VQSGAAMTVKEIEAGAGVPRIGLCFCHITCLTENDHQPDGGTWKIKLARACLILSGGENIVEI
jgi:hypothetical protein